MRVSNVVPEKPRHQRPIVTRERLAELEAILERRTRQNATPAPEPGLLEHVDRQHLQTLKAAEASERGFLTHWAEMFERRYGP